MTQPMSPAGELPKLLLQATPYSVDELVTMARAAGGAAVPAHINRDTFSVISNLGFIPPGLFNYVEVAQGLPCPRIGSAYKPLYSSDAHSLGAISEPVNFYPRHQNRRRFPLAAARVSLCRFT